MKMRLVITTYFQDIAGHSYDCQTRLQLTFKPHTILIPPAMASSAQEQNKRVVRQFFEAFD